jgi:hypothetical protein
MSPSQGRYLHRATETQKLTDIHASDGIRIQDPSVHHALDRAAAETGTSELSKQICSPGAALPPETSPTLRAVLHYQFCRHSDYMKSHMTEQG